MDLMRADFFRKKVQKLPEGDSENVNIRSCQICQIGYAHDIGLPLITQVRNLQVLWNLICVYQTDPLHVVIWLLRHVMVQLYLDGQKTFECLIHMCPFSKRTC